MCEGISHFFLDEGASKRLEWVLAGGLSVGGLFIYYKRNKDEL